MSASPPTGGGSRPDEPSNGRSAPRFRGTALASGLVDETVLASAEAEVTRRSQPHPDPVAFDQQVAAVLVERRSLTRFQAEQMLAGRRKLTLGQYRIIDAIGQGGMGQVFRAEHSMMGRIVAIKVLPRAKSTPDTEAAFQREIRMLGRLDHDNLVRALDAGHDGKVYYLVTEFVSGLDLRKQVLRHGPLDEVAAASVIAQAARGLAYAHEQGLVHRDVKPGNLLVTEEGRVKVLDLGLAGSVLEAESMRLGRVVGTMDYMAPEQIRSSDEAGPAADIYSLGCTLYFALAGQVPFPGGTRQEKARRHLSDAPPPIRQFAPQLSDAFVAVLDRMMEKSQHRRIKSAAEVVQLLRPWTPESPVPMTRTQSRRHRRQPPAGVAPSRSAGSRSAGSGSTGSAGSSGHGRGIDVRGLPADSHQSSLTWSADAEPWPMPLDANRQHVLDGAEDDAVGHPPRPRLPLATTITTTITGAITGAITGVINGLLGRSAVGSSLRVAARVVVVAGTVGVVFGAAIGLVSRINPRIARELLGEMGPAKLGWYAFVLMLVVQCLAAFSSRDGRNHRGPGRR